MVGSQFRLRARDVQRRHGADFQLFLIVIVKFFGNGHRLLLHVHVIARKDQFPIRIDCVGDRGDGLQRECPIRDLAVILGNVNLPLVDAGSETI